MTKFCFSLVFTLFFFAAKSQFSDQFTDGDYTNNPEWVAVSGDFIVNSQLQLQSANTTANATFTIVTESSLAQNAQWEFWTKVDFNTSSANYIDVWLMSAENTMNAASNSGYFIRIGSADDNISLYKKTAGKAAVLLIEGTKGVLNTSSSVLKIKVIRTPDNKWILLRYLSGSGTSYRSEGAIIDDDITTSSYFGISIRQSTASFFQKHFFDDFEVRLFEGAPSSFQIESVKVTGSRSLQISFQNPLNIESAEILTRYHVNHNIGNPVTASVDAVNGKVVNLEFAEDFEPNVKNSIIIDGVADVFGNTINQQMFDFYFYKATAYDVVIDEVFADPSPQIGLPAQKFIELKNVAGFPVNLMNWRLYDGSKSTILPAIELLPDSFLIITTTAGLEAYSAFGTAIAVSNFPSLNISGGEVSLLNSEGSLIHAMQYDLTTYRNEVKKDGGFSLEMINTKNGCGGAENWIASTDNSGGTPGRKNAVDDHTSPETSINITGAWLTGSDTLMISLNKTVDSASAVRKENFSLSGSLIVKNIQALPPFFNALKVTLNTPAAAGTIYTVTLSGLTDCAGNTTGKNNTGRFGISETPAVNDVVINEILSEPKTSGSEYVELYNNSNKIFDVSELRIANRNSSGVLSAIIPVSPSPKLFFPKDFLLLTKDPASVIRDYPFADASAINPMSSFPSYPNDKGVVVLTDQQGNVLDEVNYDKSWHFTLIKDKKSVALERIDYNGPSEKSNFFSASKDMGYGTPGIKNSQNKSTTNSGGDFTVDPEIFSPDNDGIDDFVTIHYSFGTQGHITNIKIFDASGRMVRYLEKNSISGTQGYYRWDGLDDKGQKLSQGIYVIYFESFNENGKRIIHKKSVVLARRVL